jgi:hypothetical protein
MLAWCEQDVDLGAMLPIIATYVGHVGLASSQRYLQLTPDLLGEVIRRHQGRFGQQRPGHPSVALSFRLSRNAKNRTALHRAKWYVGL